MEALSEFAALLQATGVEETCDLRSGASGTPTLGFMAYHGGSLERVTDIVAREAAERSGVSYYGVTQSVDPLVHIPSSQISPAGSPRLAEFLDHVDAVITVHGYGRKQMRRTLLLGGRNRALAGHLASHLRPALPKYEILDDVEAIPRELRGQHRANPVNLPRNAGVQIELPPVIRWNMEGWHWSDQGVAGRAPDTETLIETLATAATSWTG